MFAPANSPKGIKAVGIFLCFGAVMACLAGTTLLWRGTLLDRVWILNASAYNRLASFGQVIGIPFLLLGVILLIAGVGWLKSRPWGWWLAVAVVATQVVGNIVNVFTGDAIRGLIGATIATALIFYLLRHNVRAFFAVRKPTNFR